MALVFLDEKAAGVDFSENIVRLHPKLSIAKSDLRQRNLIVNNYFDKYYSLHNIEIKRRVSLIREKWREVEPRYFQTTEELFGGFKFPDGQYIAYASIVDCNPRFLDSKVFQFFYKKNIADAIQTISHELLHFIFFDFVKRRFHKLAISLSEEKLWDLSEIFNVVVLRSENYRGIIDSRYVHPYPDHKKLIPLAEKAYRESKDISEFIERSAAIVANK